MKNENDIYKLLNETKTNFFEYEEIDISYNEKQKLLNSVMKSQKTKQRTKKCNKRPLILTFAAILVILWGSQTSFGKSVQAAASSLLENIQYTLSQVFKSENNESSNASISVNQVASFGDAEIKIEDLLFFEGELLVNVLVDLAEPMEEQRMASFSKIAVLIDGELLPSENHTEASVIIDERNNISQSTLVVPLSEEILSSDLFTLEIHLQDIHVFHPGKPTDFPIYIEGEANFSIETTMGSLTEYTDVVEIKQDISVGELDYHIKKLTIHPILSFIELSSPDKEQKYQLMEFRGVNEEGKSLVFLPRSYQTTIDSWKGIMMLSEEDSEITAKELADSEWIELQLYSAGHPEGEAHYQSYGEPFVIEIKK